MWRQPGASTPRRAPEVRRLPARGGVSPLQAWACASAAIAFLSGSVGCRPPVRPVGPTPALTRIAAVPPFRDDGDQAALAAAARASLAYLERLPNDRTLAFASDRVSVTDVRASIEWLLAFLATSPSPSVLARELDRRFVAYRAAGPNDVLFTGYFLPVIEAHATGDERFSVPVLTRPSDLVTLALERFGAPCGCREQLVGRVVDGKLEPYLTRADIETRGAPGSHALAWTDDPIALFFLQIQGSGILSFPDGTRSAIGFAGSNGHPYVSIGKLLIASGDLPADGASAIDIRNWLVAHPDRRDAILRSNPRYVFFRWLDGPPVGSLGVPVVGGRTIATDPLVYPPGALSLIRIPPDPILPPGAATAGITRLAFNLDAGAAIRGPGRVDVFFGEGAEAEAIASRLRSAGELYFLAPRATVEAER